MYPTPGRIVLFYPHGATEPQPAVVVAVTKDASGAPGDGSVLDLHVLPVTHAAVPVAAVPSTGHWIWPPRS